MTEYILSHVIDCTLLALCVTGLVLFAVEILRAIVGR